MMLLNNVEPYFNGNRYNVYLKANMDHSELDQDFFIKRSKNDARLVDEINSLRDAK
jgi:hypothetical protein